VAPDDIGLEEYAEAWIDMAPHVPTLRGLAYEAKVIVEFGVRGAVSTWALLEGMDEGADLYSVDIDPNVPIPKAVAQDKRFHFIVGDSLKVELPDHADLVMIDSSHEFTQTVRELARAAELTPAYIACHDYLYSHTPQVKAAVDGFVMPGYMTPPEYQLAYVEASRWGLAVLERR
jgi:predicted O-methyltransferase YrrM